MGAGKTLTIRSLQTECNALVFDLTPSNLEEKFDKAALKKLIWTVIIVAKEFQPSIVMIDDFEQIFSGVKKKKKDQQSNYGPKMKKSIVMLKKKNKLWTKNDQIAVIGCTNKPY
jgi:ATP-dependent 26S proteasome regulatory subunit